MDVSFTIWNVYITISLLMIFKIIFDICLLSYLVSLSSHLPCHSLAVMCLQSGLLINVQYHLYLSLNCHQSVILIMCVYFNYCTVLFSSVLLLCDDSSGLGDDMLDKVLTCLCSSGLLPLHSNNRIVHWVFCFVFLPHLACLAVIWSQQVFVLVPGPLCSCMTLLLNGRGTFSPNTVVCFIILYCSCLYIFAKWSTSSLHLSIVWSVGLWHLIS